MTPAQEQRLFSFFYLLTRGSPGCRGLPWGEVKALLRELPKIGDTPTCTSHAGELLARELLDELLYDVCPKEPTP